MKKQFLRLNLLLLSSTILVFTLGLATPHAFAVPGDFLGTVTFNVDCPSGIGVGIAMDGTDLWYSCYGSGMDLKRADATTGIVEYETDIVANGGLGALSYDATRDVIWAGDGSGGPGGGGEVYKIQLVGPAGSKTVSGSSLEFDVDSVVGACGLDDGLAFDARSLGDPTDDRLYYSNDCGTTTIRTFTLAGALDESFPWTGTGCYNSGLAVGGQLLLQGSDGCSHVWVVDKTTKLADFDFSTTIPADPNFRDEDLECDTKTFGPTHVMWSKEAFSPMRAHAFEFKLNQCGIGGVTVTPIGGEILPIDVTALFVAGTLTNAIWMAPVIAGAVGTTAFYLKTRMNKE